MLANIIKLKNAYKKRNAVSMILTAFLVEMERFELSNSFPSYTISNRAPSTGLGDISEYNNKYYNG